MTRFLALFTLFATTPALAAPRCPTEDDRSRFAEFQQELAGADTVEEAREEALSKLAMSHQAVDKAAKLFPRSEGVAEAEARLDALELAIRQAETPEAVADQFAQLDTQAVSCNYDTVEIVIIVIGFVFAIIPGIIFLFLFC